MAALLIRGFGVMACCMALQGCTSPEPAPDLQIATPAQAASPQPTRHWEGWLSRKGSDASAWWALQEPSGTVWRLELPAGTPSMALESRQNCPIQAAGSAKPGPLGRPVLQADSLSGLIRPQVGDLENQRCQFQLPAR